MNFILHIRKHSSNIIASNKNYRILVILFHFNFPCYCLLFQSYFIILVVFCSANNESIPPDFSENIEIKCFSFWPMAYKNAFFFHSGSDLTKHFICFRFVNSWKKNSTVCILACTNDISHTQCMFNIIFEIRKQQTIKMCCIFPLKSICVRK